MAISGVVGAVWKQDGNPSTAFTDEATTKDTANKRYTITNAAKKYWDDTAVMTVKKNGVVQSLGFNLEYPGGVVEFAVANIGTDVILVSGKYFGIVQCSTLFNWKLDVSAETKDVTTFASNGWKEIMSTVNGWDVSCDGYWADGSFLSLLGANVILVLYVDDTSNKRYEGYIFLKKDKIDEAVDEIVKESLDFEGDGRLYYHDT